MPASLMLFSSLGNVEFNKLTTELTTAATDVVLGLVCLFLIWELYALRNRHPWKVRLWSFVFGLLAAASFLGAVAHGFDLSPAVRNFLWQPLYLALGIDVALFVVGGVLDSRNETTARRLLIGAIAIGVVFYFMTIVLDGAFFIFVVYEGVAMAATMVMYIILGIRQRLPGASIMAVATGLNIVAAMLQSSTLSFTLIWTFDHNGIFHLAQIIAVVILGCGLRKSLSLAV
jgi:hypothetical protein